MLKPSLQLRLGQQLTMTPQLQQAIRLLQLPTIELQAHIRELLESNVMLEQDEDTESGTYDSLSSTETARETAAPRRRNPGRSRRRRLDRPIGRTGRESLERLATMTGSRNSPIPAASRCAIICSGSSSSCASHRAKSRSGAR